MEEAVSSPSASASASPTPTVLLASSGSLRAIRAAGSLWRGDARSRAAGPPSAAAFAPDGGALAVCADPKTLLVLACDPGGDGDADFRTVLEVSFPKRLSCVAFSRDGTQVLVADRFGNVHIFPVSDALALPATSPPPAVIALSEDAAPLLGHFALVTSVATSPTFVATGDRENRVRISHFPRSYDIHAFCLGHTAFITRLAWTENGLLLSGAGDGSVRLWDPKDGAQVAVVEFPPLEEVGDGGDGGGAVVAGLELSPVDSDVAAVFVHDVPAVFILTGLSSRRLKVSGRFVLSDKQGGSDAKISGVAFSGDGQVLVSERDRPAVMMYKLPEVLGGGEEVSGDVFTVVGAVEVCEVDVSSRVEVKPKPGLAMRVGESGECTPGEWLASLRKLVFDPEWKGKGTRRPRPGSVDDEEVDGDGDVKASGIGGESESKVARVEAAP